MSKAIEVFPIELLKALPPEFWTKVPTWSERRTPVGSPPPLAKEFPEYFEFWKYVVALSQHPELCYHPVRSGSPESQHDWVELVVGKTRQRYKYVPERGKCHLEVTHEDFNGIWVKYNVYRQHDIHSVIQSFKLTEKNKFQYSYQALDYYCEECKQEKKLSKVWNRLRKKYRRELGTELPVKEAINLAAQQKAVAITKVKMATGLHINILIDELTMYKREVADGSINRKRVREIFDMTNELTSLNAKLKNALGIR